MRALLLCAGYGTRLRPLTNTTPKCLVSLGGRPLLHYWLKILEEMDVNEVLINLHYLPEMFLNFLKKNNYKLSITTVTEPILLGTGGTLKQNREFFKEGPVLLVHADNLSRFSYIHFMERFNNRDNGIEITMMTYSTDDPKSCGICELSKAGNVINFYEKVSHPPGNIANGAVYILSSKVLDFLETIKKTNIDFSLDVIPHFLNRINTFKNDIYHRDIGTLNSLEQARKDFKRISFFN